MNRLTGLKDLDREILKHMSDRELLTTCSIDKRFYHNVCDDHFLRRRLRKYFGIEQYKTQQESWKQFFLNAIYSIYKMKEDYGFDYTKGDFGKQYSVLKKYGSDINLLLNKAVEMDDLSLFTYALSKGGFNDQALHDATEHGSLEIVKYFVEKGIEKSSLYASLVSAAGGKLEVVKYLIGKGANIHAYEDAALRYATYKGRYDIVKYLVENGANIHLRNDAALKNTSSLGHYEIVKYLIEQGADIHNDDEAALRKAISSNHFDIAKYLIQQGADIHVNNDIILKDSLNHGDYDIVRFVRSFDKNSQEPIFVTSTM